MQSAHVLPARLVSILGHPLLVLPLALLLPMAAAGTPGTARATAGIAVFAALVLAASWWHVRRGRWRHVDASQPQERRGLNRLLLALFSLGTVLALPDAGLALRLALAAAIIAMAMLAARWCKLSLHAAFAVYAALLLWAWQPVAGLAMLAFAAAVVASRLLLARHTLRDVMVGVAVGAAAGICAWQGRAP